MSVIYFGFMIELFRLRADKSAIIFFFVSAIRARSYVLLSPFMVIENGIQIFALVILSAGKLFRLTYKKFVM